MERINIIKQKLVKERNEEENHNLVKYKFNKERAAVRAKLKISTVALAIIFFE